MNLTKNEIIYNFTTMFLSTRRISKLIRLIISNPVKKDELMLGRWKLTRNETELELKIRRANEDHCGVCVEPPPKL